jgi:hypothetical protein
MREWWWWSSRWPKLRRVAGRTAPMTSKQNTASYRSLLTSQLCAPHRRQAEPEARILTSFAHFLYSILLLLLSGLSSDGILQADGPRVPHRRPPQRDSPTAGLPAAVARAISHTRCALWLYKLVAFDCRHRLFGPGDGESVKVRDRRLASSCACCIQDYNSVLYLEGQL